MSKSPWHSRDHCGLKQKKTINQAAHEISYETHQDDHMMIIYDHVYVCIYVIYVIYDYKQYNYIQTA